MNWFKKISSFNLRFTDEIEQDISEVTDIVTNYFIKKNKERVAYDNWSITNPYSGEKQIIKLVIFPEISGNQIAFYNQNKNTLSVFPYNLITKTKDKDLIRTAFKNAILHEVVHAIDPKINIPKMFPDIEPNKKIDDEIHNFLYYSSPIEFEAYSKQITEDIKNQIVSKPEIKQEIEQWLRFNKSTGTISVYSNIFQNWEKSDIEKGTNYMRQFKIRLFNEIIKEKSYDNENIISTKNQ